MWPQYGEVIDTIGDMKEEVHKHETQVDDLAVVIDVQKLYSH
jgi:hypothetical protein